MTEIAWGPTGELVWKPIEGFEGRYDVSSDGNVRSWLKLGRGMYFLEEPRLVKKTINPRSRYRQVNLLDEDGKSRSFTVHRLVLETFVGEPEEGFEAAHLDGDKSNNRLENLAWKTRSENMQDKREHGTASGKRTRKHYNRLNAASAAAIRELRDSGWTKQAIADAFGVSWTGVHYVLTGRTWSNY